MPQKYCEKLNFVIFHNADPELICEHRVSRKDSDCLECKGLTQKATRKNNTIDRLQKQITKLEDRLHIFESKKPTPKRNEIIKKLFFTIEEKQMKLKRLKEN